MRTKLRESIYFKKLKVRGNIFHYHILYDDTLFIYIEIKVCKSPRSVPGPAHGPANERWFSQLVGLAKEKWVFQRAGPKEKGRQIIWRVSPERQKKKKKKFSKWRKNNNNVSDLGDNKCKCANEMCLSIFITGLEPKIYWFLIIIKCVSRSSSSFLFSYLGSYLLS